jgi:hypothetical protein
VQLRRSDELLRYVHQARHAEEHGIDPISTEKPAHMAINPKKGITHTIGYMERRGGQLMFDPETAKNIVITFHPAQVRLLPVVNRGVVFRPPVTHLGVRIDDGLSPIR